MYCKLHQKKYIAVIFSVISIFTLTACDKTEEKVEIAKSTEPTPEVVVKPEVEVKELSNKEKSKDGPEINMDDLDSLLTDVSSVQKVPVSINSSWNNDDNYSKNNIIAKIISKGLAAGFNHELKNSQQWNEEQKKCFGKLRYNFAIQEVQSLVVSRLNATEYNKATKFYNSSLGRKVDKWAINNIDVFLNDDPKKMDSLNLTNQEKRLLIEFGTSDTGRKLQSLIKGSSMEQIVLDKTKTKFISCNMI